MLWRVMLFHHIKKTEREIGCVREKWIKHKEISFNTHYFWEEVPSDNLDMWIWNLKNLDMILKARGPDEIV